MSEKGPSRGPNESRDLYGASHDIVQQRRGESGWKGENHKGSFHPKKSPKNRRTPLLRHSGVKRELPSSSRDGNNSH